VSPVDKLYDEKFNEIEIKAMVEEVGSFVVERIDKALEDQ
jgi:hypothetical protein